MKAFSPRQSTLHNPRQGAQTKRDLSLSSPQKQVNLHYQMNIQDQHIVNPPPQGQFGLTNYQSPVKTGDTFSSHRRVGSATKRSTDSPRAFLSPAEKKYRGEGRDSRFTAEPESQRRDNRQKAELQYRSQTATNSPCHQLYTSSAQVGSGDSRNMEFHLGKGNKMAMPQNVISPRFSPYEGRSQLSSPPDVQRNRKISAPSGDRSKSNVPASQINVGACIQSELNYDNPTGRGAGFMNVTEQGTYQQGCIKFPTTLLTFPTPTSFKS